MYRQLVLHSKRSILYLRALPIASRRVTTTPPPSAQGKSGAKMAPSRPEGNNTLIVLSALGALGGLYYYYTRGQPSIDREHLRQKEEETRRNLREIEDMGKSKVENVAARSQRDYDQAKTKVHEASAAARTRATEMGTDVAERARRGSHEMHAKLGELKDTAEQKMRDARDRSEKQFGEDKEEVERQARAAKNKARGWFGWGSK